MKRRILSILLCLALCISMLSPLSALAYNASDDDIIEAVLVIFHCKEGTYDSVNRNDNGALSIGKLQWHGARALELMKEIVNQNPGAALNLLGDSLYEEIVGAGSNAWNYRTLTSAEGALFSSLLATDLSRSIQDALGRKDITDYIVRSRRLGIQDAAAIVYYCDLQNQYGPGGAESLLNKVKAISGKSVILSVDELHKNLMQVTSNYRDRRNWVHDYCSTLDWTNLRGYTDYSFGVSVSVPYIDPNLDLQPPEITKAEAYLLNPGAFQVEVQATDNQDLKDCRVEVGSDVAGDKEYGFYGKLSGNTWIIPILTERFSDSAKTYYINITVSDESGNGTSTRLEVSRDALATARLTPTEGEQEHTYRLLFETKATALNPACRVEQCSDCHVLRTTFLSPASGIQ